MRKEESFDKERREQVLEHLKTFFISKREEVKRKIENGPLDGDFEYLGPTKEINGNKKTVDIKIDPKRKTYSISRSM